MQHTANVLTWGREEDMPWHEAAALGHEAPSLKGWLYSISYMGVLIYFCLPSSNLG